MVTTLTTTPAADGFGMPGEFEPHRGTWMVWPERPDNWRLGGHPAQQAFRAVAEAITEVEPVTMAVSHRQYAHARRVLPGVDAVEGTLARDPGDRLAGSYANAYLCSGRVVLPFQIGRAHV